MLITISKGRGYGVNAYVCVFHYYFNRVWQVFRYSALKRYSNFIVYSMKKQFVKTISTIIGQINSNKYSYFFLWAWSISLFSNNYDFFISLNMNKGIASLELNSSIKQRGVKKVIRTVLYFLLKALNISTNQLQVLRVTSFTNIFKCFLIKCRTTSLEKKYEWLFLTVKIFLKNIAKYY